MMLKRQQLLDSRLTAACAVPSLGHVKAARLGSSGRSSRQQQGVDHIQVGLHDCHVPLHDDGAVDCAVDALWEGEEGGQGELVHITWIRGDHW